MSGSHGQIALNETIIDRGVAQQTSGVARRERAIALSGPRVPAPSATGRCLGLSSAQAFQRGNQAADRRVRPNQTASDFACIAQRGNHMLSIAGQGVAGTMLFVGCQSGAYVTIHARAVDRATVV